MPFGRKKAQQEEPPVEEPSRLFSSSKKQARPSFTNTNPYAANAPDPYTPQDPYAPASNPPPYQNNGGADFDRYRQDKSPVPPGGYGGLPSGPRGGGLPSGPKMDRAGSGSSASAAGQSRYGAASSSNNYNGYGDGDRYGGSSSSPAPAQSRYGTRGYGGLGVAPPAGSVDEDTTRSALFGNAPSKYGGRSQADNAPSGNAYSANNTSSSNPYASASNPYAANNDSQANRTAVSEWESGKGPGYGQETSQGYGNYEERNLTAEEIEEEEVTAAKQEIRNIKQQDVSSTRNALRIAQQAEETGRATLERLGAQGERIHNTERNLDLASNQNRLAAEKARELKTLNRSMFAIHVDNPFTSKQRTMEREQAVLDQARRDREERDATRAEAWGSTARAQKQAMSLNKSGARKKGSSLAERSKYQFEADSEDEQMEDEIDNNLDLLHGAASRLKNLGLAMGEEVDAQNQHIDRIGGKVDIVDDEIALNRSRLDRIR